MSEWRCLVCPWEGEDGDGHTRATGHPAVSFPAPGGPEPCTHGDPRGPRYCAICRRSHRPEPERPAFVPGRDDPGDRRPDPAMIDRDGTLLARQHTPTQAQAAALALPKSGTRRRLVYEAVLAHADGLTDTEMVEALGPGWDYSRLGPRRRELVDAGLLVDTGLTRPSPWTGAQQTVWRAVPVR